MFNDRVNIIALLCTHRNGRQVGINSDLKREKTHKFTNAKNNKIAIQQHVKSIGCDALIETGRQSTTTSSVCS